MKPYLSICTMYRDHASYLLEWLEFHRLVGAEHFFLYDNGSEDDHHEVLAPYLEEGLVDIHEWPVFPGLLAAFDHCLEHHRDDSRWIAFIDIDEFLFSPTGTPVPEILRDYEEFPGVGVNRVPFGPSGHRTRPPGLVIENYVRRPKVAQTTIKSIVDPRRAVGSWGVHRFRYRDDACAVDELKRVLDINREITTANAGPRPKPNSGFTESFSAERLRVNHYGTKSVEEFQRKFELPRPDTGEMKVPRDMEFQLKRLDGVPDDGAILQYLPALREALAARQRSVA
jgi:Glycosyltransferase family 92